MSGYWQDDTRPHAQDEPLPPPPDREASEGAPAPHSSVPAPPVAWSALDTSRKPSRWFRKAIIVAAVMSVVVVVSLAAAVTSKGDGVSAALATVFSSPTLRVVITAHTTDPQEETSVSQYSVVLAVTSENGSQPLSATAGADEYEVSVLRGGVDLGDVIVAGHAVYARVNFRAIVPGSYANLTQSLRNDVPPGPAYALGSAFLDDEWVGIDESTIVSYVKSLGVAVAQPQAKINFDGLRDAFTLSFAQAWDAWVSIHELSSANGVTEYSLELPVQHFVASFVKDLTAPILNDLPAADVATARSALRDVSGAVNRIPAGLEIPMTMWVTNGSLSRLDITYKGDSLDLAISHPTVGVTAPVGAVMVTRSIIHSLSDDFGLCPSTAGSAGESTALSLGSSSCQPPSSPYSVPVTGTTDVSGLMTN
jgi:hypothetical protein